VARRPQRIGPVKSPIYDRKSGELIRTRQIAANLIQINVFVAWPQQSQIVTYTTDFDQEFQFIGTGTLAQIASGLRQQSLSHILGNKNEVDCRGRWGTSK
jgi:hypothetical protein